MISNVIKNQIHGVFGTYETNLFTSLMPEKPDNCIVLYDEPGSVQPYQHDYGSDWVGLHLLMRGTYSYVQAIWDIHNTIVAYENIGSTKFTLVRGMVQTVPSQVDIDDKGRLVWSAHYLYLINPKTTNRILI